MAEYSDEQKKNYQKMSEGVFGENKKKKKEKTFSDFLKELRGSAKAEEKNKKAKD